LAAQLTQSNNKELSHLGAGISKQLLLEKRLGGNMKNKLTGFVAAGLVLAFTVSAIPASAQTVTASPGFSSVSTSLKSKYEYFKKNPTKAFNAVLNTKCVKHPRFSFSLNKSGAYYWVRQSVAYKNVYGVKVHPVITFHIAKSPTDKFVLSQAAEDLKWWKTIWGCPDLGKSPYNSVGATTQELINAGY
jgi:hypothetical protein